MYFSLLIPSTNSAGFNWRAAVVNHFTDSSGIRSISKIYKIVVLFGVGRSVVPFLI